MSADSHTVCPKCHPDALDYTGPTNYPLVPSGVVDHLAEERGYDRDVRENIDYYLIATGAPQNRQLKLIFEYSAHCWTCGWDYVVTLEDVVIGEEDS